MYNQIRPASTSQRSSDPKLDQAIERGMKWVEQASFNMAGRMLPKMADDKQATIWGALRNDPHALQSYVIHLGKRQGITDPIGLDKLASEYISAQSAKFGE